MFLIGKGSHLDGGTLRNDERVLAVGVEIAGSFPLRNRVEERQHAVAAPAVSVDGDRVGSSVQLQERRAFDLLKINRLQQCWKTGNLGC